MTGKSRDALVGTQLGNFVIERRLAEGGMGRIYAAVHTIIGRKAAIKVLSARYSNDQRMIKRLHHEARAVNRIGHPNIIDVFDFGRTADRREYFVMEYLEGETLAGLLERKGRVAWPVLGQIAEQLLDALAAAHDLGIVHRDIKPENIFLCWPDPGRVSVKVLDFGIAKSLDLTGDDERLTRAGTIVGTPEYMAPEQIRGRSVDGRADVYSVAVILYEALAGRRPFEAGSLSGLLLAHLRDAIPSLPDLPVELGAPAGVDEAITKGLSKQVGDRLDARGLAKALGLQFSAAGVRQSAELVELREGATPAQQTTTPRGGRATVLTTALVRRWRGINWAAPLAVLTISSMAIALALTIPRNVVSTDQSAPKPPKSVDQARVDKRPTEPQRAKLDLTGLITRLRRELRKGTDDSNPAVRRLALQGLGELRDGEAHALLLATLNEDPEGTVRGAAALALSALGGGKADLASLRHARSRSSELVRVAIDEASMRLGGQQGRINLRHALKSRSPAVALSAALALGQAFDRTALPTLLAAIAKVEAVQQPAMLAAVGTAAMLGHRGARSSLERGLKDPSSIVALGCAEALARLGDDAAMAKLRDLLKDERGSVRLMAARALAGLGDFSGLETARRGIESRNAETRALAASGLGAIADPVVVAPLQAVLGDAETIVRMTSAASLAHVVAMMPDPLVRRTQNWVFSALERGDWTLRHAAVEVTAAMDPELAIELLGWALRDRKASVRRRAVLRLAKMVKGRDRAATMLEVAIADTSPIVRASAADALGQLGGKRAEAILATAVVDRVARVGIAAAGALLKLGSDKYLGALQHAARQRSPELRAAALQAIGRWKDGRATALLAAALRDRDARVRQAAAIELAQRGDARARKELQRALKAGAPAKPIVRALARVGVPVRGLITRLASSKRPADRAAAVTLASQLLPASDGAALFRKAAVDSSPLVRRATAKAVGQLGTGVPLRRTLLRRLRSDTDAIARVVAIAYLAQEQPRPNAGEGIGTVSRVKPVRPAPLPKVSRLRPRPRRAKLGRVLFVDDTAKLRRYKMHLTQAALAQRRGRDLVAVKHLRKAMASYDTAAVHFELGLANLKLGLKARNRGARQTELYLRRARRYFQIYLRRAPVGTHAKKARGGLRDIISLLRQR